MSRDKVCEKVIGRLLSDEELRIRFAFDPLDTIADLHEQRDGADTGRDRRIRAVQIAENLVRAESRRPRALALTGHRRVRAFNA